MTSIPANKATLLRHWVVVPFLLINFKGNPAQLILPDGIQKPLLLFQRFSKWLWLREADAPSFMGVSSLEEQLMLQEVVSSNPIKVDVTIGKSRL